MEHAEAKDVRKAINMLNTKASFEEFVEGQRQIRTQLNRIERMLRYLINEIGEDQKQA